MSASNGFRPVPWLPGPHLETIVPALMPAKRRPRPWQSRVIPVEESSAVQVHQREPHPGSRGTLLLLHGLGGSADSRYMWWTSRVAAARGWVPVRMNARNAGGTEALSTTLYNAGQSDDVDAVLADLEAAGFPRPFAVVGFSLGGNTVLRYAGTRGAECRADHVVAVNPPVELDVTARELERPENRVYRHHFTRLLVRQLDRIRRIRPVAGPALPFWRVGTIRRFDTLYIAPAAGHPSAEAYYAHASSGPRLAGIRVPGLVLSTENDPFVPSPMFEKYRTNGSGPLRWRFVRRGGHLGYWSRGRPRFWAATAILDHLEERTR
ncbi:MAG: alpha/beta fold hydrolase [Acidobacteriota bacterium]